VVEVSGKRAKHLSDQGQGHRKSVVQLISDPPGEVILCRVSEKTTKKKKKKNSRRLEVPEKALGSPHSARPKARRLRANNVRVGRGSIRGGKTPRRIRERITLEKVPEKKKKKRGQRGSDWGGGRQQAVKALAQGAKKSGKRGNFTRAHATELKRSTKTEGGRETSSKNRKKAGKTKSNLHYNGEKEAKKT